METVFSRHSRLDAHMNSETDRTHRFKSDKIPKQRRKGHEVQPLVKKFFATDSFWESESLQWTQPDSGAASCSGVVIQHKLDSTVCACLFVFWCVFGLFFKDRERLCSWVGR